MKNKKLQFGFTLAEMLVALVIIALMAAAAYILIKPAEDKGKIESTKATIELLCGAIEQYHNFYNEFPDPNNDTRPAADCNDTELVYYRLSLCPDSVAILNQIDSKMVRNYDNDDYPEYVDAWGNAFKYEYRKNNEENFPLIISAGPDKKFGNATNSDDPDIADNITSRK
ncbi:MAG: type II secretion system protein [Phycisphaerae bacterium]|jgi:prepilin-type N-terminal cleavage/methylation domain-containing protein